MGVRFYGTFEIIFTNTAPVPTADMRKPFVKHVVGVQAGANLFMRIARLVAYGNRRRRFFLRHFRGETL